jgi:hypothetical protein
MNKRARFETKIVSGRKLAAHQTGRVVLSTFCATEFCVPIQKYHPQKTADNLPPAYSMKLETHPASKRTTNG